MKIFVFKLILVLVCIELLASLAEYSAPFWYRQAERQSLKNPIKYIFIGSSRVACSIIPHEFVRNLNNGNLQFSAVNMGRGYSTMAEHYFGIRRLAATMPGGLKGVVVFMEAPQSLLDLSTWQQSWFHPDYPELLTNTMIISDLRKFWQSSDGDLEQKLMVTGAMLSASYRLKGQWINILKGLMRSSNRDATQMGGIRSDSLGVKEARKLAYSFVERDISNQKMISFETGDQSIMKSLNDFITAAGGKLVLFRMPMSSVFDRRSQTEIAKKNRAMTSRFMTDWNIPLLQISMQTTDDDFPDLWHLRGSRAAEFTRRVALDYLRLQKLHCRNKGEGPN